ncbi:MAG: hypothetical protein D6798_19465 [Deltaproteobacteria bacterium]|nr:MAG: hypothetical protein D6798_19465 [Deltaproteobacteria bacterium]
MRTIPVILPVVLVLATACEEKKSGITVGSGAVEGCDLAIDKLADTTWVMLRPLPDKSEIKDPRTRMRILKEDGQFKVKYNVGSLADVYTYGCEIQGEELICAEEAKLRDICQALLVGGAECTAETLQKYEKSATAEEVAKAIEEATANVEKYRNTDKWKQFELNNNNLGNKLQGRLYIKVDTRKCRLRVTDNYMTIYNGKEVEDSNPVGTNPFVKWDGGELLFEHCTDSGDIAPMRSAEYPADLNNVETIGREGVSYGEEVHFWYLGQDARDVVDGCKVTYDLWFDGQNPQKGLEPEVVEVKGGKKEYRYHWSHTWTEPFPEGTLPAGVTVMHRRWTCEDPSKSGEEVACAAVALH